MNPRIRLLAIVAGALAVAAFLKRPVTPPDATGTWRPADNSHLRR